MSDASYNPASAVSRSGDECSEEIASQVPASSHLTATEHISATEQKFQRYAESLRNIHVQQRKLLAYDFHDGLVQDLIAAKMVIDQTLVSIDSSTPESSAAPRESLQKVHELIANALDQSRRLLDDQFELSADQRLSDAIELFVNRVRGINRTAVKTCIECRLDPLTSDLKTNVYRMIQQAVYNALFHADADTIIIRVSRCDDSLTAVVEDDGRGIAPETERVGIGVDSIRQRAAMFDGTVSIDSLAGSGTTVSIAIPLNT